MFVHANLQPPVVFLFYSNFPSEYVSVSVRGLFSPKCGGVDVL